MPAGTLRRISMKALARYQVILLGEHRVRTRRGRIVCSLVEFKTVTKDKFSFINQIKFDHS